MSDERTCATCWHCGDGSDSGTCLRCRASGDAVSEYREDPEAIAEHLRARVAELERERDAAVEAHAQLLSRIAADGTLDAMERAKASERRVKRLEARLAALSGGER